MNMSAVWKERLAKLIKYPIPHWGMVQAIKALVPRHRVGVAMTPINSRGEILLLRHVFHPSAPWGLPGGWLGRNEDPAEGVIRELHEETGLRGTLGPIINVQSDTYPSHLGIAFIAFVEPGEMRLSGEILEAAWFSRSQLPSPLLPFVRSSIEAAYNHLEQVGAKRQSWLGDIA